MYKQLQKGEMGNHINIDADRDRQKRKKEAMLWMLYSQEGQRKSWVNIMTHT